MFFLISLQLISDITPTSSSPHTSHLLVGDLIQSGSVSDSLTAARSCDRLVGSCGQRENERWREKKNKVKHAGRTPKLRMNYLCHARDPTRINYWDDESVHIARAPENPKQNLQTCQHHSANLMLVESRRSSLIRQFMADTFPQLTCSRSKGRALPLKIITNFPLNCNNNFARKS